jgi:hypothetical protein
MTTRIGYIKQLWKLSLWHPTSFFLSSEAFSAKTQAISLPYPGLATSNPTSKSRTYFPKRASKLGANTPLSTKVGGWQDCDGGGEGVLANTKDSKEPNSIGSTIDDPNITLKTQA